jgi:3-hydroxy-3-methylglutaryl CoA synthase/uncharacterized OB-fold protein
VGNPVRIRAVGAAAPSFRVDAKEIGAAWGRGGRGVTSACAPDEDALTLAAAAAQDALAAAGVTAADIDGLWWGVTRPPFAEGPSHAVLASAIGLQTHAGGALSAGSTHAGIDALLGAADAIAAGAARQALVVASDALVPGLGTGFEARCGAGAAAVVLSADSGAATLGARVTHSAPLLDRYRGDRELATRDPYDARLVREDIFLPAMQDVGPRLASFKPRAWSLPDPDGRLGAVAAKTLGAGTPASAAVFAAIGDAGAAAALLGIVGALDAAGIAVLIGSGGGRTTGVCIDVEQPVPGAATVPARLDDGTTVPYATVLRARGQLEPSGETIPMGVPPGSAMFVRGADEMLQMLGARCVECGTINTPPSIHPACIACGASKFETVPLARHGVVHTFVVNQTMPPPFVAPLPIAVIDLDDGARIMLQVVGDGKALDVGSEVELVLRKYADERGVPVYGYKARELNEDRT